jgi:hypothetical protein
MYKTNKIKTGMKKLWPCILFIGLLPLTIFGQNAYISTDSTTIIGLKLVDGGEIMNSRFCQVKKKNEIIKYTPNELIEYGLKDGRIFISREIQLSDSKERVFLERLNKEGAILFYYRGKGIKSFFLEKDSSLFLEIQRHNQDNNSYTKQLMILTSDCSNVLDAVKFVRYNKKSMSKLISRYNNCELKPFPHLRYGLVLGYELANLNPSPDNLGGYVHNINFRFDGGLMIGFFLDIPILVSDFSLNTGLNFSKHGYSFNKLVGNQEFDFVANISSLKLPVLIRYTYPSNRFRPFVNLGGIMNYNIKNENLLYETTITEDFIEIDVSQNVSLIDNIQVGYSIGSGIELSLDQRSSMFLEFRYDKLYGSSNTFFRSLLSLTTGIIF